MNTGHATKEELAYITALQSRVDMDSSPASDLLELGRLYHDPLHQDGKAIEIFEHILRRESNNGWAKFWLAHCYYHYLMDDEANTKAVYLLESCLQSEDADLAATTCVLLPAALKELGKITDKERIKFYERSIALRPEWADNRYSLACAYEQAGRITEAIQQLEIAQKNLIKPDPNWTPSEYYFELEVRGRIDGGLIEDKLKSLRSLNAEHENG